MMLLEPIYQQALVGIIARKHHQTLKTLTPLSPAEVLPRDAFNTEEEWTKWVSEIGPAVISRSAELVNEGHIPPQSS